MVIAGLASRLILLKAWLRYYSAEMGTDIYQKQYLDRDCIYRNL